MIRDDKPLIAIACGGTGGHLFPGLAVAEQFLRRKCAVSLFISPKEVDQQAVKEVSGMRIVTLPAVGLERDTKIAFARGFIRSYRAAKAELKRQKPKAALAMGGFTSVPLALAAKRLGAKTFLHESNIIPGRANRWLSLFVERALVGFPAAGGRLRTRRVRVTGTPVRPCFCSRDAGACRQELGLDRDLPVVLVVGGSQGASGLNDLMIKSIPLLAEIAPTLQFLHLSGPKDSEQCEKAYSAAGLRAKVHPFLKRMELALGAATIVVSRAGASSLAEIAAMRVPAVLIPFPAATDQHQFHNAHAFEETGAARLLEQITATPEILAKTVIELVQQRETRERMRVALERWQSPHAAEQIAEAILEVLDHQRYEISNPIEGKGRVDLAHSSLLDSRQIKDTTSVIGSGAS